MNYPSNKMRQNTLNSLIANTEILIAKCTPGGDIFCTAPESAMKLLKDLPFDRLLSMTKKLSDWSGGDRSIADTILRSATVGAIAEFWLKTFYCIYVEDYDKAPIRNQNNNRIGLNTANFAKLIIHSNETLFRFNDTDLNCRLDKARALRNSIHLAENKDLSSAGTYEDNLNFLYELSTLILKRIPNLEQ